MKRPEVIFVTGASGFVGANLVRKLLSLGYEVHVLLREPHPWRLENIKKSLVRHNGTLLDKSLLEKLFKKIKPSYIFHLAAYGAYPFQKDGQQMIDVNIVGLSNLLYASKNTPYKGFVVTGSSSEYGNSKTPMKETNTLIPDSFYAATKASATYFTQVFAKALKKPIIIFRLFSVYGPFEEPTRLVPTVIMSALNNNVLKLTAGSIKRDFVYVNDVVSAYLQVMKRKVDPGEIYNIGTGKELDNDTIAQIVNRLSNNHLKIKKGAFPQRSWDKTHWVANTAHTKKSFHWVASTTVKEGLTKTYEWFVKEMPNYQHIYGKV